MKKVLRILLVFSLMCALFTVLSTNVYAISEEDVRNAVNSQGREAVSGNVFIWFLCAIAFLKVSQKIDSFMSSLGINVGHTGGSMLAEAMIASRGVMAAVGGKGGFGRSSAKPSSSGSSTGTSESGGFMSGGVVGAVGRSVTKSAIKSVTGQPGGSSSSIGRTMFNKSLSTGGNFSNNITSTIAHGQRTVYGTMTGETAVSAFSQYMGISGRSDNASDSTSGSGHGGFNSDQEYYADRLQNSSEMPVYSGVEIGGGVITGYEAASESSEPVQFAYYATEQFSQPESNYSVVTASDNTKWYKQYAQSKVEKTPFMTENGEIKYTNNLISALPAPPRRKDRI